MRWGKSHTARFAGARVAISVARVVIKIMKFGRLKSKS
jgi:hypothetical protein